jgi:hypothetical protein
MFKTVSCKEISGSGAASIRDKTRLSDARVTFIIDFTKLALCFTGQHNILDFKGAIVNCISIRP